MHLYLDSESPSEILMKEMDENTGLKEAFAAWKVLTFEVDAAAQDCLNNCGIKEEEYYETILMDMIQRAFDLSETEAIIHHRFETSLHNNLGLAAELLLGEDNSGPLAQKILKLKALKINKEEMSGFLSKFSKDFGKVMDGFDTFIKVYDNVYEFIEKVSAYQALEEFCDTSLVSTLDNMRDLCPSSNFALKVAIGKVRNLCADNFAAKIYESLLTDSVEIKVIFSTVLGSLVKGAIVEAGLLPIYIAQQFSKGTMNFLFNTDETMEQYYQIKAYCEIVSLLRQAVLEAEEEVKTENTADSSRYLIDSLALYYASIENSCDYAAKFADIQRSGFFGRLSKKTYEAFLDRCWSIKASYYNAHFFLLTDMWQIYFQSEYPALYTEYMELQGMPVDISVPVEDVSFPNAAVTWPISGGVHYITANVVPENASNKAVKYTSSNSSVVAVSVDGKCTPINVGTAVITAAAMDGSGVTDTMSVTVSYNNASFNDENNEFRYTITDEDEVSVYCMKSGSGYTVSEVPERVTDADGKLYEVTAVDDYGFANKKYLESVILPGTIRKIGQRAFEESRKANVNMPESLEKIGESAFDHNYGTKTLDLPEGFTEIGRSAFYEAGVTALNLPDSLMTIGENAFYGNNMEELVIPKGVLTLGRNAFSRCSSLTTVTFYNCYASIGEYCFSNCSKLEQVQLGRGVNSIKDNAFYRCIALKEIVIPTSVSSIGRDIFAECEALKSIAVTTNNPYYASDSGVLLNKAMTVLYCYPDAKAGTEYTVPETVTTLAPQAFMENQNLEKINLPDGLQYIDTQAISTAENLMELIIPDTVVRIGSDCAANCPNLEHVKLSASLKAVNSGAFRNCYALSRVDVTQDNIIERIENNAFQSCNLSSFDYPAGLVYIGSNAFYANENLASGMIPDTVTSIGASAYAGCKALTSLHVPSDLEKLGESAFAGVPVKSVVIPEGITQVPKNAFYDCKNLVSITLPTTVTSIGYTAFCYGGNLTVTLLGSMPKIDAKAFYDVENLVIYYPAYDPSYEGVGDSMETYQAKSITWIADPNNRVSVSKCKITLSATTLTYTGKALKPKVTLTYKDNTISTANYTVSYKDNTNPGIATITIKGRNGLKGTVTKEVKIAPKAPKISSAANGTTGITVKWNKVANATGYVLYRDNKAIKTIAKNTTVQFLDTGAKTNGTIYTYKIRSYFKTKDGTKINSSNSSVFKAVYLSRPAGKLANSAAGKLTVSWGKNSKATGYQVRYNDGTTTKTVTIKSNTTVKKILTVKKGKTYTVEVRSYKTYNEKNYYSPWSAKKSLKISK